MWVMGRVLGLKIRDSSRRNRRFREQVAALVDREKPRAYNHALLDLANQACKKRPAPGCFCRLARSHFVYGTNARTAAK